MEECQGSEVTTNDRCGREEKGRGDVLNTLPYTRHTPTAWSGALWLGKYEVSWTWSKVLYNILTLY